MNIRITLGALALVCLSSLSSVAAPFEPKFSDYSFPGTQYTVDAPANTYFSTNYGITIDNAYLYKDSRDTFDGIGVSAGEVSEIGTTQTARINFLDTTNFVTMEYWTIRATTYSIVDVLNNVLATVSFGTDKLGTYNFSSSTRIAALIWTSGAGYGQVTGLKYDYDGKTDGRNDDLDGPPSNRVPETSSTLALGALAMAGLIALRRRR